MLLNASTELSLIETTSADPAAPVAISFGLLLLLRVGSSHIASTSTKKLAALLFDWLTSFPAVSSLPARLKFSTIPHAIAGSQVTPRLLLPSLLSVSASCTAYWSETRKRTRRPGCRKGRAYLGIVVVWRISPFMAASCRSNSSTSETASSSAMVMLSRSASRSVNCLSNFGSACSAWNWRKERRSKSSAVCASDMRARLSSMLYPS
mmetsp:Transcript_37581/g.96144  ORF Transcript_37581/g.96144 Transcript_37581/m.96144 type:complete len:207 (+) Transcript_37581:1008-1628(+)